MKASDAETYYDQSGRSKENMKKEEALIRMHRYCDYQERCHQEARNKLLSLKVYGETLEWVLGELIQSGHLNEERYARSLARGKFRINRWGRLRIYQALKAKHISDFLCNKAMEEISEQEYQETLKGLLDKENHRIADLSAMERRSKLRSLALRKGFEPDIIQTLIDELIARSG